MATKEPGTWSYATNDIEWCIEVSVAETNDHMVWRADSTNGPTFVAKTAGTVVQDALRECEMVIDKWANPQ